MKFNIIMIERVNVFVLNRQLEATSEKLLQLQQLVALVQQTGGYAMAGKPAFEADDIAQNDQDSHKPVVDFEHVNDRYMT